MTAAEFLPIFQRVADEFALSADARAVAWDSCHSIDTEGKPYLRRSAMTMYRVIAATRGPWVAQINSSDTTARKA